jgi:heme-degrading monooxygenase HmoA
MFAVIFEVHPKRERWDDYLALAGALKPKLEAIDGFIDNERFASRRREGWLVSLSTWRDEKSVVRWRTVGAHHATQQKGRSEIFEDYHLRVGEIVADSDPAARGRLREQRLDATEVGAATAVTLSELSPGSGEPPAGIDIAAELGLPEAGVIDRDVFDSITVKGKQLLLASWRDAAAAASWTPRPSNGFTLRHRQVRVIRDYGMFDRREAPQYYPDVTRAR